MRKFLIGSLIFVGVIFCLTMGIKYLDRAVPINLGTKTCLITGASSGIGQHLATEMVKRGWTVIGVARRTELLDKLSKELDKFIPFAGDVGIPEQVHKISEAIKARGLMPTLFFLNAGTGSIENKWDVSTINHQKVFVTNYFGAIAWIEEWLPVARQLGGGTFVATSSVLALFPSPTAAAYSASKAALLSCFKALRIRYLNDNIGFSVVLPGPVATEMLKGGGKELPFIHQPADEAHYIVEQVFQGEKQIEPSRFYATILRIANLLPDFLAAKLLGEPTAQ